MGLGVEEDLRVSHVLQRGPLEVGPGQVVEILLREEDVAAGVIDVEKGLQALENVGAPNRVGGEVGHRDVVAFGQGEHHFRLESALDVEMQLGLGEIVKEPVHFRAS